MQESDDAPARLKLRGARFDGGRIPVATLEELRRYQALIIAAARSAWVEENDGGDPPPELTDELSFDLVAIEEGCAIAVLEPEASAYDELLARGREEVDDLFFEIVESSRQFADIPHWADIDDFWSLGSSLSGSESLELRPEGTVPVEITADFLQRRTVYVASIDSKNDRGIEHYEGAVLAGRLSMLDSVQKKYALETVNGRVQGRYKDDEFTDDLHAVLASSTSAPIVWIRGKLRFREGRADFFLRTDGIQAFPTGDQPWLVRLSELAQLQPGWGEEGTEPTIASDALIGAANCLELLEEHAEPASIFPTFEGGVLLEWASSEKVCSVEFSCNGKFALLYVTQSGESYYEDDLEDFSRAVDFLSGRVGAK